MKKLIAFFIILASLSSLGFAAKKKRVYRSANKSTPASANTSAKVTDVSTPNSKRTSASFQAWLKDMKKRVTRSNSQRNQLVAVAAVRGDETADAPPLYWKGKKAKGETNLPELQDFDTAIEAALKGDDAAAKEKLQSFLLAYPESSLAPDAKETLARLETNSSNP